MQTDRALKEESGEEPGDIERPNAREKLSLVLITDDFYLELVF